MENVENSNKVKNLPFKILVVLREGKCYCRIVYDNREVIRDNSGSPVFGIHRVNVFELDGYDLYLRGDYTFKDHKVIKATESAVFYWKTKLLTLQTHEQ